MPANGRKPKESKVRLRIEGRGWFVAILLMITIMSGNECEISFEDENGVHTHVFQKEDIRDANGGRMQLVQIQKSSL